MIPPTEKISAPVQSGSTLKTCGILPPAAPSSMAWEAPVPKANPLILKKRPTIAVQSEASLMPQHSVGSASPFPAPVQAEAFTVPRPVILEPMSPWGQPVEKVDFLALWRTGRAQAESEFSRPPFRAVRSSDPWVGLNCSPC